MTEICQQAQIIIHEMLVCVDACPAAFERGYNLRLLPLKVESF